MEKIHILYLVVIILIIGMLIIWGMRKKSCSCDKEGFNQCVCNSSGSGRGQTCQNIDNVWASYQAGITENNPNWGVHKWSTVSPGDVNFPPSNGCGWSTAKPHKWIPWDFTDFGSSNIACDSGIETYSYTENQPYEGEMAL